MLAKPKRDGTVFGAFFPSAMVDPLMRPKRSKYDVTKFNFLGSINKTARQCIARKDAKVKKFTDLFKHELTIGATARGGSTRDFAVMLNKILGTKFKVITGYKGGGAMNLAVERGETMGRTNYYSGYLGVRPHWLREGKIRFLGTIGPPRKEVANVPRIRNMVKPGIEREMIELLEQNFNVGQAFYVPPGVPKDRVNLLRKSFAAMLKDPAMIAEAKKRGVPTFSRSWQQVEEAVQVGFNSRKEVQEKLATILGFRKKKK